MHRTQGTKQICYNSFLLQIYLLCFVADVSFCLKDYNVDISRLMTYYSMVFMEIAIQTFHLKRKKETAFRKY